MFRILAERLRQGHRTPAYPDGPPPPLPDRFRGRPVLDAGRCPSGCTKCAEACPTGAILGPPDRPRVDLGRCLFCADCVEACPEGAIRHEQDHRLAVRGRDDLIVDGGARTLALAAALEGRMLGLFGRSLRLRQVSAGGCNACESDSAVLQTVGWDMARFGIQFVASPRHADALLVTGAVSLAMRGPLRAAYDAMPGPKLVVAVGACAISGGPYAGGPEQCDGASGTVPIDVFIPGCPPHPLTILDGLLRLLGRLGPDDGDRGAPEP